MAVPDVHDISSLERDIENAEGDDRQLHKLYNNLGLARTHARLHNQALEAHRAEKNACFRLLEGAPRDAKVYVELAIAYRLCGDATMRVERLRHGDGRIIRERARIFHIAHSQHYKGLQAANKALRIKSGFVPAVIEVQAATASVGHTAIELGLETGDESLLQLGCAVTKAAAQLAKDLPPSVKRKERKGRLFSAAINYALALNRLGNVRMARTMLESTAVFAKKEGDSQSFLRAVANLVDALKAEWDLDAAKTYAEMWVEKAEESRDEHEEANARRRLGGVLWDLKEYKAARDMLEAVLVLNTDKATIEEARQSLDVVEGKIADDERDEKALAVLEAELLSFIGNPREEALKRAEAGDLAHNLRKYGVCIDHLERFMHLVDTHKHECDPDKIGFHKQKLGRTVADLAEACWRMKRTADAVRWGTRELLVYGDEKAGQAQAWCNLGNYLSDAGETEKGIEALRRSILYAEECGEEDVLRTAKDNLDIELEKIENLKKNGGVPPAQPVPNLPEMQDFVEPVSVMGGEKPPPVTIDSRHKNSSLDRSAEEALPRLSAALRQPTLKNVGVSTSALGSARNSSVALEDRNSVVYFSGDQSLPRRPFDGTTSSAVFSTTKPLALSQKVTKSALSGAMSSAATSHYKDVADAYKKLCAKERSGFVAREGILSILRTAAANCIMEVSVVNVDLGEKFLSDTELRLVLRALAVFDAGGADGVNLSLARNPLLTDGGLRSFTDDASSRSIIELDLTGCGIDGRGVVHIANACRAGALTGVRRIDLGKNGLGRSGAAADACAKLLIGGVALEEVGLAMNKISRLFFTRMVNSAKAEYEMAIAGGENAGSRVNRIDLSLNNSRNPAAMLEFEAPEELIGCVRILAELCPRLGDIDVRACGAGVEVRRALYELNRSSVRLRVIVVSPGVFDEADR